MDALALKNYSGNVKLVAFFTDNIVNMYDGSFHYDKDFTDGGKCEKYIGLIGTVKVYSAEYSDYLRITCAEVVFSDGYEMTVCDGCVEATYEPITPLDPVLAHIYGPEYIMENKNEDNFKALTQQEKDFADKAFLALCSNAPHSIDWSAPHPIDWKYLFDRAITVAIYRTHQYENMVFDKNCDD